MFDKLLRAINIFVLSVNLLTELILSGIILKIKYLNDQIS
jgi:hypothetical protein